MRGIVKVVEKATGFFNNLLITPEDTADLPAIMRWLLGVYTMRYNACFKTCGRVWSGRYFSRAIRTFNDYITAHRYIDQNHITAHRYIDQNPVKAKLVNWPRDWLWCACYHRARGMRSIVNPLPEWLLAQLPAHSQLALPGGLSP